MKRRRGHFLVQVIVMLPLIAAISMIAYQLTIRVISYQGVMVRRATAEARARDILRRIERDTGTATRATLSQEDGWSVLTLNQPALALTTTPAVASAPSAGRTVRYRSREGRVIREERVAGSEPVRYDYALGEGTKLVFLIEEIGGRAALVWSRFDLKLATDQGPLLARRWTTAATINRGGAS